MRYCLALLLALLPCAAQAADLWDVAARAETSHAQAARAIPAGAIVTAGEQHDNESHHQAQLETIKALHAEAQFHGRAVAVGLEMFQRRAQPVLDAWVAGSLPEAAMAAAFAENWTGEWWPIYKPVFDYCRARGIPMLGLNVPREIVRQVGRQGFASLAPEQVGQLPPVACVLDPEYEEQLRAFLGPHGQQDANFTRFCEAQLVWDTAMAFHSLEYQKAHPDTTVVVLAGYVHAWKRALPWRVARLSPSTPTAAFLPDVQGRLDRASATPQDADYLYLNVR